jgi:hypothetical protein
MFLRSLLQTGLLLFCAGSVFGQAAVQPYDHTFACTVDTYTSLLNPTANNGLATALSVKATTSSTNQERAFVSFSFIDASFPTGIPYNAKILSATLTMTGGVTGGTPSLKADRVLNSWGNTLNHTTANATGFNYGMDAVAGTSGFLAGQYNFDVTAHVQAMVAGIVPSYGWRIKHNIETVATPVCSYHSRDATILPTPPTLRIQWYVPLFVASAVVMQASDNTQADGSVVPQVSNGIGNRRYQWTRGNDLTVIDTTSSLLDVASDWYGLRVTDATTDTLYMAFLVGVKCGNSYINFNPGRNYMSDAVMTEQVSGTTSYRDVNYGGALNIQATRWKVGNGAFYSIKSVMRFHLWMDPLNLLDTARLYLYGRGHSVNAPRLNNSELVKVTTPWKEYEVTYAHLPATTANPNVPLPAIAASTPPQNSHINTLDFWNDWKLNNTTNYGVMMRLMDTTSPQTANLNYQSSDNISSLRPYIQFMVHGTCNRPPLSQISYSELKREPDAGYTYAAGGKLKFYFTEEYKIASNKNLPMRIYDQTHQLVGSVDIDGAQFSGLATLSYTYADNRYILNLDNLNLQNGQIYLLEVETSTAEKRYLKFLYNN